MIRSAMLLVMLGLVSACMSVRGGQVPVPADCETALFGVHARFEGGGMAGCEMVSQDVIRVRVEPENTPINPSPWYAVAVVNRGSEPALVTVELAYQEHGHRYRPKLSPDGDDWRYVDPRDVTVAADGMSARVAIMLGGAPVFLTAQEVWTREDHERWMAPYRRRADLRITEIGRSVEGRAIELIRSRAGQPEGSVVLVGRQHPPEVPGAIAMEAFVDEVLSDSALARGFRERFDLRIVPFMNPDGVARGFWRHNAGGVDLNRDWGPFSQPETRAVRAVIDELAASAGRAPVLFLDFHATRRNVFYTQPEGRDGTPGDFTARWLSASRARLAEYTFERSGSHQADLPTSKNYMHGRFAIPAITYEVGDETDRDDARKAAAVFAQEMMRLLTEGP